MSRAASRCGRSTLPWTRPAPPRPAARQRARRRAHPGRRRTQAASGEAGCAGWFPQDLSNLLWACGTLRHARPGLLRAVVAQARSLGLGRFSSQALSNSAWGAARLCTGGVGGAALVGAADAVDAAALCAAVGAEAAERDLRGFRSQEVANVLWAETVVRGGVSLELSASLATWLSANTFHQPQELSIALWAISQALPPRPPRPPPWPCAAPGLTRARVPQAGAAGAPALPMLLAVAGDRLCSSPSAAQDFSPQAVANIAWAAGRAASRAPVPALLPILSALEREAPPSALSPSLRCPASVQRGPMPRVSGRGLSPPAAGPALHHGARRTRLGG